MQDETERMRERWGLYGIRVLWPYFSGWPGLRLLHVARERGVA